MFDYKLLEALSTVVEVRGFDKAAEILFVTQSAISQRVKLLEEQSGQILITRQNPPIPTEFGKKLIKHYHQVKILENDILKNTETERKTSFSTIKIGPNADSLATWFLSALRPFLDNKRILIDLKVDDQDETKVLLKNGEVSGCISSSGKPVQGCSVSHLGKVDYLMVCTKNFFHRRFGSELTVDKVIEIPAVLYNTKDNLHNKFLESLFGNKKYQYPAHYVPSSEKFLEMIEMELAYGVIPLYQYEESINSHPLIEITDMRLSVDLYWHHWNIRSEILDELNKTIIDGAKKFLQ